MADKKDPRRFNPGRRTLLKLALPGLVAGMAAPALLGLGAAQAAGQALGGRKALVVYYSRTGNTQNMAEVIQAATGADLVRIETVNPYPAEYRATTKQAREELDTGYKPPLTTKVEAMSSYDVVFVGSPCWWGTIGTPVISFLSGYDFTGKTVVPFMTHKGSGLGRTMSHVRELCPGATVQQGLAIWDGQVGSSKTEIVAWLKGLGLA